MRPAASASPGRQNQRSAVLHAGGRCDLSCAACDCAAPPTSAADVERSLQGGGARLVIRGATEHSSAVGAIVARARAEGYGEIVLRTNAIWCRSPARAAELARLGADAVMVPVFSAQPEVHDRIAHRPRALLDALTGMKQLSRAGLAIEIEMPVMSLGFDALESAVELVHRAVPGLRAVRFMVLPFASGALAPPSWDVGGPALARAVRRCRDLGVKTRLTSEDGIPLCALRHYRDLYDAYAFNPKARSLQLSQASFGGVCGDCAVRPHCPGIMPSYARAHGEQGLAAFARRPPLMYEQRTTRRRVWTSEQRTAASRAEILVLRPTVHCNQDCTFCSANETSANVWANHDEMLRQIARAARRGIEWLSFSGGEPTLSKHLVTYVRCASRLGISKIELISNAVLLDRSSKVAALVEAGLTDAFISLHAHDELLSRHSTQKIGDFDRTVQGIKHLVAAGVRTAINHVISARNYPYLLEYVQFVHREFQGKVRISFAFVTPQFKALDNIEVMPKLSLVMPYLKRAMYRALELGQPFNVGARQGIPFCFLDEFRGWSDGLKLSNSAIAEDSPQKQRGPECDQCRFSEFCPGLWRPYVAKYGLGELRPVPGARLTSADVDRLHAQSRYDMWGAPPSFEDVAEVLRERGLETGPPEVSAPAGETGPAFVAHRSRPMRVLLVGSGRQARRLARHARQVPGLSIDAVASPHAPQSNAADFDNCPRYDDAGAAIDDIRPEAVIIAAATGAHDELARLAIARGLPALLEKPITASLSQAADLRQAAAAVGACLVPAHNSLHAAGLERVLTAPLQRPAAAYLWRRTAGSGDTMRTWNRSFLYETVYHLLAIVGRACGGGPGTVVKASYRGEGTPEQLRLELRYGGAPAEIALHFADALEEDVLARRERDRPESEVLWRRRGRKTSIVSAAGVSDVEADGNDLQRMLANFRDVVLGEAPAGATLDEAVDVMATAQRVVEAVAAAGAPFERATAPTHVASRALRPFLQEAAQRGSDLDC